MSLHLLWHRLRWGLAASVEASGFASGIENEWERRDISIQDYLLTKGRRQVLDRACDLERRRPDIRHPFITDGVVVADLP